MKWKAIQVTTDDICKMMPHFQAAWKLQYLGACLTTTRVSSETAAGKTSQTCNSKQKMDRAIAKTLVGPFAFQSCGSKVKVDTSTYQHLEYGLWSTSFPALIPCFDIVVVHFVQRCRVNLFKTQRLVPQN